MLILVEFGCADQDGEIANLKLADYGLRKIGAPGEIRTPDPLVRSQTKGVTRGIARKGSARKHGQWQSAHRLSLFAFARGAGTKSGTSARFAGRTLCGLRTLVTTDAGELTIRDP
jgi:hypothetical protein